MHKLECGPMPNVMAAQPNIGGALCDSSVIPFLVPCPKFWLTPADGVPCSDAANIGDFSSSCIVEIVQKTTNLGTLSSFEES